jgi:hypothetical protein
MNKCLQNFNVVQYFYVTLGVSRLLQNKNMLPQLCSNVHASLLLIMLIPFMVHLCHLMGHILPGNILCWGGGGGEEQNAFKTIM